MGFTFLTPIDALFALAAVVPLAALWLTHNRMEHVRRIFSLTSPRRRELAGVVGSLALLPVLMGVAAAQPVVVRRQLLQQRLDVQAFFVLDTSRSMSARTGPHGLTRLERAKREAEEVISKLGDIPVGVATFTDRVLPELMPTPNFALVRRTIQQSVGINRPPPSAVYVGRATTFAALYPIPISNFYSPGVPHRILVVFTDGEATPFEPGVDYDRAKILGTEVDTLFVHVWAPTERIYVHGHVDPGYTPDPTSAGALSRFAAVSHGRVFGENDLHALEQTIRQEAGSSPVTTKVSGYARVALAPWFVLAGVIPLGFLLYRRNL
jgi:von Willebrand factor type A domain